MDSHAGFDGALKPEVLTLTVRSLPSAFISLVVIPILSVLGWYVISWATNPLKKYPGPFLAGFTNWWRLYQTRTGKYHEIIYDLHKQYGPIVRIGPNTLDLDYPELVKTIYSTDGKWLKTEFYENNSAIVNGKITYHIFSTTSPTEHARMKRPVAKYYSMSYVQALEPHVDVVLNDFCKYVEDRFINVPGGPKELDFGEWLGYHAWDLISSVTFSRRFGYMEHGSDFDGTIEKSEASLRYFQTVGQIPVLDYLLDKNPVKRVGPPNLINPARIAVESFVARLQGKDENYNPKHPDYLQHFIDSKETHPDIVDDNQIISDVLVNLLAGADTTAVALRAVFYYMLKNPSVYNKVSEEIQAAGFDRSKPVPYSGARQLPYLEACVRESLRIHPAAAMLLERYVPAGGITLPDGSFVPAGTAVGLNPWVVNRNKSIFGEDSDIFRPERWLQQPGEDDEAFRVRMQKWNAADLTFGNGSRICTGRNFAMFELYKVCATLLHRFEIELADPTKEWKVWGSWFTIQKDVIAKMKASNRTTGGSGGTVTTVSTLAQFIAAVNEKNTAPAIVVIKGVISGNEKVRIASNKTIIGLPGSGFNGVGLHFRRQSNLILRNIVSSFVEADNGDGLKIEESSNVWVDHCEFYSALVSDKDFYDGLVDISHGSEWVTISHNGSEDTGHLHVTYANNYWEDCGSRGPLVRFGTAHIYNSYYENKDSKQVGYAVEIDNDFGGASNTAPTGSLTANSPPYSYSLLGSSNVAATVPKQAGAILSF
ncbi:cytochrome P450 [Copromyces sp. CBS 386.78]|nr:cytochrome P450 [Copromyces sp. CBS 386.78]